MKNNGVLQKLPQNAASTTQEGEICHPLWMMGGMGLLFLRNHFLDWMDDGRADVERDYSIRLTELCLAGGASSSAHPRGMPASQIL